MAGKLDLGNMSERCRLPLGLVRSHQIELQAISTYQMKPKKRQKEKIKRKFTNYGRSPRGLSALPAIRFFVTNSKRNLCEWTTYLGSIDSSRHLAILNSSSLVITAGGLIKPGY